MSHLPAPLGSDRYLSLENGREVETKVKGSTFLAQAFGVRAVDQASDALGGVRKRHFDATHHCSAWRIGPPESPAERTDDDGEPSGTAGLPILGAIHRGEFFDALIVVTRYFGGTKLGTGGLVRAYADAARGALEAAGTREVFREAALRIACHYEDVGSIETILAREGRHIRHVERAFATEVAFEIVVLSSQVDALRTILMEATSGRAMVSPAPPG